MNTEVTSRESIMSIGVTRLTCHCTQFPKTKGSDPSEYIRRIYSFTQIMR